ncbi:MAG: hypothetical protein ACHREM_01995 [Polyangiales bacterium]
MNLVSPVRIVSASLLVTAVACGGGSVTPGDGLDGGSTSDGSIDGGVLGFDGATSDGTNNFVCTPACTGVQICSAANSCIAPGTCLVSADCSAGMQCVGDAGARTCQPGSACGSQSAGATNVPSNLMIVLDRSCSMRQPPSAGGAQTKWQIAVAALAKLTSTFKGQIRFGLKFLPDPSFRADTANECKAGSIQVALGDGNETTIDGILAAALAKTDPNFPSGPCVTPIDTGVEGASTDPGLSDTSRADYMIVITDGQQAGCSAGGGAAGTVTALKALAAKGVKTFVVGFGGAVSVTELDAMALAGGVPASATSPNFYNATDAASLDTALAAIGGTALSCTFKLSKTPPDPSQIYAFFDKTTDVPRDPTMTNGWQYDATTNTVTFYGADCTKIETGVVKVVDVVFGCDVLPK